MTWNRIIVCLFISSGCKSPIKDLSVEAIHTSASPAQNGKWDTIYTLKDLTNTFVGTHEIPRPNGGWWVAPIHVNLTANGKVLITGWSRPKEDFCEDHQGRLNGTTFLLDPSDLSSQTGEPIYPVKPLDEVPEKAGDVLYCAGHAPLDDGRILFMGGARYKNLGDVEYPPDFKQLEYGLPYARIFNPNQSVFSRVKNHNPGDPRPFDAASWPSEGGGGLPYEPGMMWYPTNTRLPGGRILTNGGLARWTGVLDPKKWSYLNKSVTIFDRRAFDHGGNPWSLWVSHNNAPREVGIDLFDYPRVFLLPKSVLVAGIKREVAIYGGLGWDPKDPSYMPSITFLSLDPSVPENKRFATPPNSKRPLAGMLHETTSALLPSGEILIMGGGKDADQDGQRIDIYNPENDSWRSSLNTGITRQKGSSTLLPDGTVLILGGEDSYQADRNLGDRRQPTIFDSYSGKSSNLAPWSADSNMRGYHNVSLLLKDGRVLVGGGRIYTQNAEGKYRIGCERPELRIFSPPYLFKGPRPTFTDFKEQTPISINSPKLRIRFSGANLREKKGVVLMALGAFTHSFDQNQRQVPLDYKIISDHEVEVTPPPNNQVAPEGEYNLFLISDKGVPSLGKGVLVK